MKFNVEEDVELAERGGERESKIYDYNLFLYTVAGCECMYEREREREREREIQTFIYIKVNKEVDVACSYGHHLEE